MTTLPQTEEKPYEIQAYAQWQFAAASKLFDSEVQAHQLMCKIYWAYAGPEAKDHNCLGCNFNDQTLFMSNFLELTGKQQVFSLHHSATLFYLLLNGLWERIGDVFRIVSVPESYQSRYYGTFIRARRWTNFFKHPNEFGWLVHHPTYTIAGSTHHACLQAQQAVFIDDDFVKKYYSKDRQSGLSKEFSGKERQVVVVLPDIVEVTKGIAECLKNFVDVVTKNPLYHEMLADKATIINYFDAQDPLQGSCL